jgi:hypothetical protein
MKGFIAYALLGVLLASPVAAQIAGSGKRTPEAEAQLAKIRKAPPKPTATFRAEPKLSGAPRGGNRTSPVVIVDVRAAKGLTANSGVRVFRGSRVSLVRPGVRQLAKAPANRQAAQPDEAGPRWRQPPRHFHRLWDRPRRTA